MALMFMCAGCHKIYAPPRGRGRCPDCQRDYYAAKRERQRKRRAESASQGIGGSPPRQGVGAVNQRDADSERPAASHSRVLFSKNWGPNPKTERTAGRVKVCRHCGQEKPTNDFRPNPRCRDGLSSWCASCHDEASARSKEKRAEREAPIVEAQRKEVHAKWMAEWRASVAQRRKQIAENRRKLEAKSRKTAA